MRKKGKRIIDGVLLLLLLLAFTVPRTWLTRVCGSLATSAQQASAAVRAGEDPTAHLRALEQQYEKAAPRMRLFLDHSAVDELGAAIGVSVPEREDSALLAALNTVQAAVLHLEGTEAFRLDSIF